MLTQLHLTLMKLFPKDRSSDIFQSDGKRCGIQQSTNATIKRIKITELTLHTWDTTLITLCRLIKEEIRKRLLCCLGTWALVKENNLCSVKAVDGQHCMKGKSFDHQL